MRFLLGVFLIGLLTVPLRAVPVVDGTVDAEYGTAISVQTTQTNFGDASPPGSLGGSELDAAYGKIVGGRLYLMLNGNHEPNFNKPAEVIAPVPGGKNTLTIFP